MDNNKHLTFEHLFTKQLKDAYKKKKSKVKRIYAIMTFNTEVELGLSNKPYKWVNSSNTITVDGTVALYTYIHSTNPMTIIVHGETFKELNNNMIQMVNNFKDQNFVNKEIDSIYY